MTRVLHWLARLDARYRIVVGLAAGMIVFFSLRDRLRISTDGMASWDTVGFLLGTSKSVPQRQLTVHLVLTLGTVIVSWALVHTVFGLRYAHSFYGDSDDPKQSRHAAGLIFPGERPPDYFDFAYYAFVVGMTCQVSDVQITSRKMRRLTLMHSGLAFGFNTIILALLINTVSSLI